MKRHWFRGDVFKASFTVENDDHLQDRYRPWLIVQNNMGNKHSPTTIVVPLTSRIKREDLPTHCIVEYHNVKKSIVLCEQVRTVDFEKDWEFVDHLPPEIMAKVDQTLKNSLGLN